MTSQTTSWQELISGRNAAYSLVLFGATILHAINVYITITILPSVVKDIGGLDYYAWNTTLFVVASILGAALATKLLHGAGPRGAYLVAALVFAAGTVVCALAPSMTVLLVGRFVQGLGGGLLYTLTYALIRIVFAERLWARAIGIEAATWGIATLAGPAIGGMFAEFDAWRAAFWLLLLVTGLFALVALVILPKRHERQDDTTGIAWLQLLLLTAATLVLSWASILESPGAIAVGMAVALLLTILLFLVEARARIRLLPSGGINVTTRIGALYAAAALLSLGVQPEIYVPYFIQVLHGQSPFVAGYLAALMSIGWTSGSLISAGWSEPLARRSIVVAPVLMASGLVVAAIFMPVHGEGDWLVLAPACLAFTVVGLGIGLGWPHLYTHIIEAAPAREQDLAVGAIVTVQLFAWSLGAAAAGMTANFAGITDPGGVAGASLAARWLFAVFALAPLAGLIAARRGVRS
ncbi:MAG: MFS transporter [Parvibaculaceae bacterium]